MLTEAELLQYIYQTTEMGRDGIQSVLPHAEDETFHQALEQQLTEYEKLYGATGKMLRERGQEPKGLNPMVKASSEMMSAMKTMADHSTSKIAEMMIQGNTMGMTKSLKHLHDYHGKDERVRDLANKLLKTEEANIQQMKKFLSLLKGGVELAALLRLLSQNRNISVIMGETGFLSSRQGGGGYGRGGAEPGVPHRGRRLSGGSHRPLWTGPAAVLPSYPV